MGKVIVFGNHKGGVGKSTLAVLYAYWLADLQQQSVCVIDLDAQANSSKSLARFATGIESAQLFHPQRVRRKSQARRRTLSGSCWCPAAGTWLRSSLGHPTR